MSNEPHAEIAIEQKAIHESQKIERTQELYNMVESDLQTRLVEASTIQNLINDAKTQTKKCFCNKKFEALTHSIKRNIIMLQKLGALLPQSEGSENDVIDSTATSE